MDTILLMNLLTLTFREGSAIEIAVVHLHQGK